MKIKFDIIQGEAVLGQEESTGTSFNFIHSTST